jgi:hypothetical protein
MVKVGLRYVLEGRQFELLGDRGIVHENVDSAKVLDGGADHDPHLILRSDVDAESRRFKSDPRQFLDAPLRFANTAITTLAPSAVSFFAIAKPSRWQCRSRSPPYLSVSSLAP